MTSLCQEKNYAIRITETNIKQWNICTACLSNCNCRVIEQTEKEKNELSITMSREMCFKEMTLNKSKKIIRYHPALRKQNKRIAGDIHSIRE